MLWWFKQLHSSNNKQGFRLRNPTSTPHKKEEPVIISTSEKKKKKDEGSASKQLKKQIKNIKLDDEEDIAKTLEDNILGTVEVQESQLKFVFKSLSKIFSEQRKNTTTVDEMWKFITERPDNELHSKEEFLRCLVELDAKNKIMYVREEKKIYSMH